MRCDSGPEDRLVKPCMARPCARLLRRLILSERSGVIDSQPAVEVPFSVTLASSTPSSGADTLQQPDSPVSNHSGDCYHVWEVNVLVHREGGPMLVFSDNISRSKLQTTGGQLRLLEKQLTWTDRCHQAFSQGRLEPSQPVRS